MKQNLGMCAAGLLLFVASAWLVSAQPVVTWVGSWAASQQIPEPQNALAPDDLQDATLRQVVHLSAGGIILRVRLSNAFGTAPLHLTSAHVAHPVSNAAAAIDPASDRALTFSGRADVTIPAGADYLSDPLGFVTAPGSDLAVSIHYDEPPRQQTGHPGSRATSYLAHGDLVSAADLANAKKIEHWYQLSGVDVGVGAGGFTVVALGDSITDGHGSTTNGNDRWPDVLAQRLERAGRNVAVVNAGIGGNHLLTDGLGPNALARFDRDVLGQAAVREVIVLEGINDLGKLAASGHATAAEHAALVEQMIAAYKQIVARAHAGKIRVIGGTILPYVGCDVYHPDAASERDREAVNAWIRAPGHFDAVIDFDAVMRDPSKQERLRPAFDCGDHLHPSPAGYAAMANAIPLRLFDSR